MSSLSSETLRETMLRDEILRLQSELDSERSARRADSADLQGRLESALIKKDLADRLLRGIESLAAPESPGCFRRLSAFFRRAR